MNRRLAAILAADIVGYSTLMAEDEARTLEALRRLRRELFHPAVAGHRGKVVKSMGDGWLVEFGSAIDAVNCAVQVQAGLERGEGMRLRVGIHVGDITHEEEDIYGDGVNVAARLEAIAEPGAVVISDAVFGTLDHTLTPSFEDAGERELKNIPRPVRVWVRGRLPDVPAPRATRRHDQRVGFPVVVAIQPVTTSDPRPEVGELAAALTSDLFNYLDDGRWLKAVVTETPPDGALLMFVTLRTRAERLRLDATVRDRDRGLIWSHRIDGDLSDSFDWQDRAGAEVARGAMSAIDDAERARVTSLGDHEMTAATWMLKAMTTLAGQPDTALTLLDAVERAIELDPSWATPYAHGCASGRFAAMTTGSAAFDAYRGRFEEWYWRGCAFPNLEPTDELRLAHAAYLHDRLPEPVMLKVERVLRRFPYHKMALGVGASVCAYRGASKEAVDYATKLLMFCADPDSVLWAKATLGRAHIQLGNDRQAIQPLLEVLEMSPRAPGVLRSLISAYGHLGMSNEVAPLLTRHAKLAPATTISRLRETYPYGDTPGTRRYLEGLRRAGIPEGEQ